MAQFKFPLAAVLRHRKHLEDQKQLALSALEGQMRQHEASMGQIRAAVRENLEDLRKNRLLGPIDLSFLAAHRRYILGAQRQATVLAQKMSLLQRQMDEARAALVEAAKQRKIMEKLAERQKQRWTDDQTRRELAELDDVTQKMAASALMEEQAQTREPLP